MIEPNKDITPETARGLRRLAQGERPQERMERYGPSQLADVELLALLLRKGTSRRDVMEISEDMIRNAGSLGALLRWTTADFEQINGIGRVKALQLSALAEIARRAVFHDLGEPKVYDSPEKVFQDFKPIVFDREVELFWVLALNRKNHLIRRMEVTSGIASASLVHPREVFRGAIREGASAIIAVHNHPSGDPAPSAADIRVTRQLREASKIIDIDFLDHIIVGFEHADPKGVGYYSFSEAGLI